MKNTLISLGLVAFATAVLPSCKNEPKPTSSATEPNLPAPPDSPKPEMYLYAVGVDKLNLREEPNKNSKVVVQFPEGDFVEGSGEVSSNKEEVTLRNIPYKEPYFKVKSTTPEQHTGWAYSAALLPVYAGPRATSPDLGKISQFSMFLHTLDTKKLDSGKKAWSYAVQNLSGAQGTLADASLILLEQFLSRMDNEGNYYELTEKLNWTPEDEEAVFKNKFDMNKYPLTKQLSESGFRLAAGEGMIFPVVDWQKLGAAFNSRVTPPMKNYIEQNILEQKEPMWSDGGIIIPLEQVADRAVWWETFNKSNPYFVRSAETKHSQQYMRNALLFGESNTPAFDYETNMPTEDSKRVWAYIQQKYAGTELSRIIKDLSELLAAEGGKRTPKVEAWMNKYLE